jgi:hypothetical protein
VLGLLALWFGFAPFAVYSGARRGGAYAHPGRPDWGARALPDSWRDESLSRYRAGTIYWIVASS